MLRLLSTLLIQDTQLIQGTVKLFNDLSTALMILAPVSTPVIIGYFLLRKSMSSEHDHPMWDKRIKIAGACLIGIFVAGGLIKAICGYYQ